ncbi:ankyrin repeat-containing domain protein, partial [Lasiosphaeria miniovina]
AVVLRSAAAGGFAALVELLIKRKRDEAFDSGFKKYLNDPNTEGCTALYLAASEGHTAVVGLLLNCEGIEHGKQNTKGWSPLRAALSNDHGEPSEILLAHTDGAKMKADRKQNSGWSAICQAASGGQLHVVNLLLRDIAVVGEIDELDADGFSALYLASNGGHARVVKRLIENGAWVNNKNNKGGLTALFAASTAGDAQLVGLLLGKYADPRIRSNEGETPLDAAVSGGHTAVVELLLGAL